MVIINWAMLMVPRKNGRNQKPPMGMVNGAACVCVCVCLHGFGWQQGCRGCGRCVHSLSTGYEQDGQAAEGRQDHGEDDQDGLGQLGAAALILPGTQRVDFTTLAVIILPASERRTRQ